MPEGEKSVEQALDDTLNGTEEVVEEPKVESASEEVVEEPKVAPKPEDEDHSEKSRLGRRLTRLETDIRSFMDEMKASRKPQEEQEEIPEVISTREDVLKVLSVEERKKERARIEYETGYLRKLESFKEDKEYDAIEKEMLANFNVRVTGNPMVDAEINFTKAKLSVTEKKIPGRTFNGRAESPKGTPTIPNPTKAAPKGLPELDEFARDFVRRTGMSEESQREALIK